MSKLHGVFCTCYQWLWRGAVLTTMQCFMYFRFCDDVMLSCTATYIRHVTKKVSHPTVNDKKINSCCPIPVIFGAVIAE